MCLAGLLPRYTLDEAVDEAGELTEGCSALVGLLRREGWRACEAPWPPPGVDNGARRMELLRALAEGSERVAAFEGIAARGASPPAVAAAAALRAVVAAAAARAAESGAEIP